MKSAAFDYLPAESIDHVFDLMDTHGDAMTLLAGGQTLLATLNMRLSAPALVVDIGRLDALRGITLTGEHLRIGALTRHVEIEESPLVAHHAPMLTQAAPHIGHRAIRNLGTFGGALVYADPAAEWPACVMALDGTLVLRSRRGERRVAATDFFQGVYTTARADDELLVACEIPLQPSIPGGGLRQHFDELARRHGDYAIVGLAACANVDGDRLRGVRLVFLSLGDRPLRAHRTEAALEGGALTSERVAAADAALRAELVVFPDLTHSAAAKTQMAATLMRRAVQALRQDPFTTS
jgi:carbon-monoxide dehydrogenase medium subunit